MSKASLAGFDRMSVVSVRDRDTSSASGQSYYRLVDHSVPAFEVPPIVTIDGRSMEPTLLIGSTVCVRPMETTPRTGDIALIRGDSRWIVHRVIHFDRRSGLVFHGGDRGGGIGTCSKTAVKGLVTAILEPEESTLPGVENLDIALRRRLVFARWRCRLFATCRSAGLSAGGERLPLARPIGRVLRRLLL
jgi:hypothetical protein